MSLTKTSQTSIMQTYNRLPITAVKGEGSFLYSEDGTKYLDFTSGIATCNLGHQPEAIKKAVSDQLNLLWHCSNLYHIPKQQELADVLTAESCFNQVFFCNSGTEANEAAIKLVRKWSGKETIATFTKSFHGRTLGSLSATAQPNLQDGFGSMLPGFEYFPYNDFDRLSEIEELKPAAVMLEIVQGEGGVRPADQEWISELVSICKSNNILIVVDEVQTGMGRTGTLFAHEQYGFEPDIMTLAKGLGSGFPIGAMLAKESVATTFGPGTHGSTFGGNPLASAAATETVNEIISLLNHAKEMGEFMVNAIQNLSMKYKSIIEVRGLGLLLGIEVQDAVPFVNQLREKDVLVLSAGPTVIRILPPLNVSMKEAEEFLKKLTEVFKAADEEDQP
ncbi:acetylornithine/succinylornithine family transaminase [Bacillus hwajinpoensis]|uniref:Acetylornithine aminotransferase n=1 Tax=Guptibacillus hwajinpoensis TaxID=208199 RepID=A0A845EZS4_9BACL|nr:aspartate aminotransferase family protein [Pseudalkalibacillus hwajinpoensis]MYL64008.1 acetylornithine/succinylornithine family transaminase [Pseudalkalibacillus hwajinpoensis]